MLRNLAPALQVRPAVNGLVAVLLIIGALSANAQKKSSAESAYPVRFDSSLMPMERRLVVEDLELASDLRRDSFESSSSSTFNEIQNEPKKWLLERIRIVVGRLARVGTADTSKNAVLRNVGALLSSQGTKNVFFTSSLGRIQIKDPSVGIIQFLKDPSSIGLDSDQGPSALVNRLFRLGLLFHDARHSDGIGGDMGLPHHPCPKGHRFAGQLLCDKFLDASIGVERFVVNAILKQYDTELTEQQKRKFSLWIRSGSRNIIGTTYYEN